MDFVTYFLISADWKADSYNLILVIINWLSKIVDYKPVKVMINVLILVEVIINVVMRHYRVMDSIIIDQGLLFKLKF